MNVRKVMKNMKNMKTGVYFYNDEAKNFDFATDLSAYDKTVFVRTVVDTLVDDTTYDSIIRDMIFDFAIIMRFTDIDTSFTKAIDDDGNEISALVSIEQFLEKTNVVDIVKANMEVGLLEQLNDAVDKSIEYRTGIHPSPVADSLASLLSTLEKKINEVDLDSMMDMAQKFAGMTGELTPESVVNAYINSGMHKANLDEIAENKKEKVDMGKVAEGLDKAIKEFNEKAEAKPKKTKSKTKVEKIED